MRSRSLSLSLLTACNERRIRRNVGEKASLNPLPFARGERTVALPSVPLHLSLGWKSRTLSSLSLLFSSSFRVEDAWAMVVSISIQIFQIRSRGGCKKAGGIWRIRYETEREEKRPRIVIVGRICAAIKRGHLSRWRVVCEILLKTLSTSIERERRVWISWRARRYLISCDPV